MHRRVLVVLILATFVSSSTVGKRTKACSDKNEIPCDDGAQCIERYMWCNDDHDCNDGSDEDYCERKSFFGGDDPNECKPHHFRCANGVCIPLVAKCDFISDCDDKSDEDDCDENELPPPIESDPTPVKNLSQIDFRKGPTQPGPFPLVRVTPSSISRMDPVARGRQWLIEQRRSNYGWDKDTPRALVALALSAPKGGTLKSLNPKEGELMSKQLQVHLAVDLFRNHSHPMTLSKLSQYINALMATCQDPRNFHGLDLVKRLKDRTTFEQNSRAKVNPFIYLTLCIAGETSSADLGPVQDFLRPRTEQQKSQDMQSISIMAFSCIMHATQLASQFQSLLDDAVSNVLTRYSPSDGNFGNVYSSALSVQALIAAGMNGRWNSTLALKYLKSYQHHDGSFGDLLATYYILPALQGNSLVSLKHLCEPTEVSTGLTPLNSLRNYRGPKYYIKYSLQVTEPVEVSHTIMMHVPVNITFFNIMRLAADMDPKYRFMYDKEGEDIVVYSISGIPNDAERGIYWALYVNLNGRVREGQHYPRQEKPYSRSVHVLVPRNADHVTFSYEPAT